MKTQREPDDYEKEEADHVAANISKIFVSSYFGFLHCRICLLT